MMFCLRLATSIARLIPLTYDEIPTYDSVTTRIHRSIAAYIGHSIFKKASERTVVAIVSTLFALLLL